LSSRLTAHSRPERRILAVSAFFALCLLLADQLTKAWVVHRFSLYESIPLIPRCLSFTSVRNLGAAWSILSGMGWLLTLIAAAAMILLIFFFRKLAEGYAERYFALMMIFSGILGNAIDRLFRGAVVDFIDVHWEGVWQYPVFNVADMAICGGVILYLLSTFLRKNAPGKTEEA